MAALPGAADSARGQPVRLEPAIAVDRRGTVGVIRFEVRKDWPGDDATTSDAWFAVCNDHSATWQQTHVAGPTDLSTAEPPAQNRFGEYQGLAGMRKGFAAIFGLAPPQATNGPTDIFFARIGPGRRDGPRR